MSNRTFSALVRQELSEICDTPWLLSMVSWIPLLLFSIMWLIFSRELPTELPVGVIDLDKTVLSRSLVRHYQASPFLALDTSNDSTSQGLDELRSGKIFSLVVIPENFSQDTIRGRVPQVTAFTNSQFLLIGKNITSALQEAQATFNARLETARNLSATVPVTGFALSSASPIASKITPLYNLGKNYSQFLIPAILPSIWQILMVAATILALAEKQRKGGFSGLYADHHVKTLTASFFSLSLLFFLQGALILTCMHAFLNWPMAGNWLFLLSVQYLVIWASIGMAALLFFITRDPSRAMSLGAAFAAPGFAFMGVTFPVTDMPPAARLWRELIPICHYIEIQMGQASYQLPLTEAARQSEPLVLFAIPLAAAYILAIYGGRKKTGLKGSVR